MNPPIRDVTIMELLDTTARHDDDEVFRWYQTSTPGVDGIAVAGETLRLTYGELRRALRWPTST